MQSKFQLSLIVSALVILHSACKREITDPNAQAAGSTTAAAAATSRANFLSGTPSNKAVTVASVTHVEASRTSGVFNRPAGVAVNNNGGMWVSDYGANQIKYINTISGQVAYTIGTGTAGYRDGYSSIVMFNHPSGVALGPDGLLYVADMDNNRIRIVDPTTYNVTTFAGSGVAGFADGPLTTAKFNGPAGIAIDANGTFYIADQGNNMIRRITGRSTVTRWCGQTIAGAVDGAGAYASFNHPAGLALSPGGSLYVADLYNDKIRKITNGNVTTLAGSGQPGSKDGEGTAASFFWPEGLSTDSAGNLYVTDYANAAIRFITPTGTVTTLAGGAAKGSADGWGPNATFTAPTSINVGPNGVIYITDEWEPSVRRMDMLAAIRTFAGSVSGDKDGTGTDAQFTVPISIAAAPDGTVYVTDCYPTSTPHVVIGTRIRKVSPQGTVSYLAGGPTNGHIDGPVASARFSSHCELAVSQDGVLYTADEENNAVRRIVNGNVSTVATVESPTQITTDAAGNIYTLSFVSNKICRISPAGVVTVIHDITNLPNGNGALDLAVTRNGHIFVMSGRAVYEYAGDNQPPTLVLANNDIYDLTITNDANDNLYFGGYNTVYKLTPDRHLFLLGGSVGRQDFIDGPLSIASIEEARRLTVSPDGGRLYMTDWGGYRIRMVSTAQ